MKITKTQQFIVCLQIICLQTVLSASIVRPKSTRNAEMQISASGRTSAARNPPANKTCRCEIQNTVQVTTKNKACSAADPWAVQRLLVPTQFSQAFRLESNVHRLVAQDLLAHAPQHNRRRRTAQRGVIRSSRSTRPSAERNRQLESREMTQLAEHAIRPLPLQMRNSRQSRPARGAPRAGVLPQ